MKKLIMERNFSKKTNRNIRSPSFEPNELSLLRIIHAQFKNEMKYYRTAKDRRKTSKNHMENLPHVISISYVSSITYDSLLA